MNTLPISSQKFRSLMGRFITGVTVIAAPNAESPIEVVAMTASSLTSVSLNPLLLLFCVRNESSFLPHLKRSRKFSVNILASHQDSISRYYGGSVSKGYQGEWVFNSGSVPMLADANASLICKIFHMQEFGDHHVVIGQVTEMAAAEPPAPALIYAAGQYMGVDLACHA
ncbi:flavin reductase family protein [Candidimonas nitroreducens]|nr:flavin reductase family protein [Candidimonas nitroreducens]